MADYKLITDSYSLFNELGWLSDLCYLFGLKRPHRDCENRYREFLTIVFDVESIADIDLHRLHSWFKLTSRAMCTWSACVLPYVARDLKDARLRQNREHTCICTYDTQLKAIKRLVKLL